MKKFILPILLFLMFIPFCVKAETKYLYDVLKDEAESGGLAKEYTGEHHDSFIEEPTHKIYHWYASNKDEADLILKKNNVIFADHCWQMIRTTDTGGIKLLYNGESKNGKCLNTRGTQVGYNKVSTQNLAGNYWYGTDYNYDSDSNSFSIGGSMLQAVWNNDNYEDLIGKYTCKSDDKSDKCTTLYLINSYNNANNAYAIALDNTSKYSSFGILVYNIQYNSPAYVGYMYNKAYLIQNKNLTVNETMLSSSKISTDYWYGINAEWGNPIANRFNLVSPFQIQSVSDFQNLQGTYTFKNTNQTYTNNSVQYITNTDTDTYYYIQLTGNHNLDYYNYKYAFGDSYTKNDDGTYKINNPTIIERKDWYLYYKDMKNKYVCKNPVNNSCEVMWYVTSTSNTLFSYISTANNFKYAKGYTYQNGMYTLDNESVTFWDITNENNKNSLNNAHYTCFNDSGECSTLSYIHFINGYTLKSISLTNNKKIEEALKEMLSVDDVNKKSSTIKDAVEMWYQKYLFEYDDFIEDSIYCYDRSISNIAGFNPNGGSIVEDLRFKGYNSLQDIRCENVTDRFSTYNDKAKIKYKVGLFTSKEALMLGSFYVKKSNQWYWLGSPTTSYRDGAVNDALEIYGYSSPRAVAWYSLGVRPMISLKSDIRYASGTGSEENPFVVDYNDYFKINVEIKNELEDVNVEIEDITSVKERENVRFKVTPIKGYKVNSIKIVDKDGNEIDYTETDKENEYSFIMPASNVTIIPSYERVKNSVSVNSGTNTEEIIIEVNDAKAVVYEDVVKFKVTPKDGYEVETIEIIDKAGNKIEYKKTNNINKYEFIMPDTDVIITPIYRKIESLNVPDTLKNPNTGTGNHVVISIIALVFSSSIYLIMKKRKITL